MRLAVIVLALGVLSIPVAAQDVSESLTEEALYEQARTVQQAGQTVSGDVQTSFPTGRRSAGYYCVFGRHMNFHPLGVFGAGATITINFNTNPTFGDLVATVMRLQMGRDSATSPPVDLARLSNDDTGGRLDPRIRFVSGEPGTFILIVGMENSTSSTLVCYEHRFQCNGSGCNGSSASTP
ncbi:MAG: hypothetical protein QF463_01020 [Vicinamibacterales bacterium]|jgi:hypothetical protein|nr:hypothetical protein [Acidobacteriota bacterium]MDP6371100.1 hypothetical protein [Vicinamibacterales bacterium]MDP6607630.1 hypothetical protein [Vicinamibacterales bacterium]|tara:strand:+ start:1446 stop:1988 length:543 start_codon:yes stop_codon:yes gene_type:complete